MNKEQTKKKAVFTKQVLVRFSEDEYELLRRKAKKAGLSHSEFIRKLVRGKKITSAPSQDFDLIIWDIKGIGNKLTTLDKIIIEKDDYTQELISDSVSLIHDANVRLNNIFF